LTTPPPNSSRAFLSVHQADPHFLTASVAVAEVTSALVFLDLKGSLCLSLFSSAVLLSDPLTASPIAQFHRPFFNLTPFSLRFDVFPLSSHRCIIRVFFGPSSCSRCLFVRSVTYQPHSRPPYVNLPFRAFSSVHSVFSRLTGATSPRPNRFRSPTSGLPYIALMLSCCSAYFLHMRLIMFFPFFLKLYYRFFRLPPSYFFFSPLFEKRSGASIPGIHNPLPGSACAYETISAKFLFSAPGFSSVASCKCSSSALLLE